MRIDLKFNDRAVISAFNQAIRMGTDLSPVMQEIGEELQISTRERFETEKSPDGERWATLSEVTLARKKKNPDKILTEQGDLRRDLVYRAGSDFVEIGSSRIYAGVHQFGAARGAFGATSRGAPIPWGDIPARPYLGVSDDDAVEIQAIVTDAIRDAIFGGPTA